MKIVCDAGPIIHLHESELLHLLKNFGDVYTTDSVYLEVAHIAQLKKNWPNWIRVEHIGNVEAKEVELISRAGDLHKGEAESFILCRNLKADIFFTDDMMARIFAESFGIHVRGSLGVVLWNVAKGKLNIKQGIDALKKLKNSSLWIADKVMKEALKAIDEINKN